MEECLLVCRVLVLLFIRVIFPKLWRDAQLFTISNDVLCHVRVALTVLSLYEHGS